LNSSVWDRLQRDSRTRGAALWLLVDSEEHTAGTAAETAATAEQLGCDALLIGASTGTPERYAEVARAVHGAVDVPVLLFPSSAAQVVPHADAILFMSLLSGRNPQYLIEEQVRGAPIVQASGLECVSTAYLLIESGKTSTVEYVSRTRPIPRDQADLACAHVLAARYMGMKLAYLEAGSGAPQHVPAEMVMRCTRAGLPLAVGGGIRRPETAAAMVAAGAQFVVTGNRFEPQPDWNLFGEFVGAIHAGTPVSN